MPEEAPVIRIVLFVDTIAITSYHLAAGLGRPRPKHGYPARLGTSNCPMAVHDDDP
jgi:hypothetical protein